VSNVYTFTTRLCGFISVARDGGKYNTRTFGYQIPEGLLEQIEADRTELLKWVRAKAGVRRLHKNISPWDKNGKVKFTYGAGDGSRKAKPGPPFVDMDDKELDLATLEAMTAGTLVNITICQRPYAIGEPVSNIGTSLYVEKVQVVEMVRTERDHKPIALETKQAKTPDSTDLASVEPAVETPRIFTHPLADVIGSAVVFGLQDILDTYIPVVGNEQRNALIELVRNEANE
jgi:hypothetical protein